MADPISTASGVVALVLFAFQSSKLLYDTVASFQNNKRSIRELKDELEALDGVLKSLNDTIAKTDADFSALKLPLLQCGKACKDFEAVIVKCTAHSGGSRTSFRDWAKLKYMDEDITGFKTMLAGYKGTISIALCDVNIRASIVTATVLKDYKEMIANTTSDLEEHLQKIDDKLQSYLLQDGGTPDEVTADRQRMEEERDSTQQCLGICAQVSLHIDQLQPAVFENISTPSATYRGPATTLNGPPPARIVTVDAFKACKETLNSTTTQLEKYLQDINNRLQKFNTQPLTASTERAAERKTIEEEMDSTRDCLAVCFKASKQADKDRANFFEDVSMVGDGSQVIVSTIGQLIFARRVTAGPKSMQVLGQVSDVSVQKLSQDHSRNVTKKGTEPQTGKGTQFEDRYGAGVRLSSQILDEAGVMPK